MKLTLRCVPSVSVILMSRNAWSSVLSTVFRMTQITSKPKAIYWQNTNVLLANKK